MDLNAWREAGLLTWLAETLGGAHAPSWAEVGVGDDAAVFRLAETSSSSLAATTDAMVEGVHFFSQHPPQSLARRLLAANLSDLAAMGARPRVALLTLGAPGTTPRDWLERFFTALRDACEREETWLAGGDVSRDDAIHLSLFLLGEVEKGRALRMDTGSAGEDLWVTGTLGDSALGLALYRAGIRTAAAGPFVQTFLEGRHRWRQLRELAGRVSITAATDVSDGLAVDLPRLLAASRKAAAVSLDALPLSEGFNDLTAAVGCDRLTLCKAGGEDFEVLFAAPRAQREAIDRAGRELGLRLTRIGTIEDGPPGRVRWLDREGNELRPNVEGYDHFRGTL